MIPIRDSIPSRTTPIVNYTMIGLCALVFAVELSQGSEDPSLIERYGMIAARVVDPKRTIEIEEVERVRTLFGIELEKVSRPAAPSAVPAWLTPLTCIFLHGSWLHILGNMWFLWIFGDNVEDRFGHLGYAVFYLASGAFASASNLLADPVSTAPTIGASGAIAGVMGAYLILYPHAKVLTLIPLIILFPLVVVPAPIFLGVWFLIQLVQGTSIVSAVPTSGVAWWAHIGGFAGGALVAVVLKRIGLLSPPVTTVRPSSQRPVQYYRIYPPRRW